MALDATNWCRAGVGISSHSERIVIAYDRASFYTLSIQLFFKYGGFLCTHPSMACPEI